MEEVIPKLETRTAGEVEEEEEEEMVSLKRSSKPPPLQADDNGNGNSSSPLAVENQNGVEHVMVEGVAVEIDSQLQLQQPEVVDEKQVEENRSESEKSRNSIYLDEQTGGRFSNGIDQMAFSTLGDSVAEIESELGTEESITTLNGDDIQKTLTNGNNHQSREIVEDEVPSGLASLLNGNSSENGVADAKRVEIDEPLRLLKEDKQEVAEWDVERVIEEQETHDLYCPNCNSCITKRVILRKRKRQIKTLQYDVKHKKIDKAIKYLSSATSDPDHNIIEADSLSARPDLGANAHNPENEPGVFRCLECFSFFFQTVSGFKIFQSFRKSGAGESVQSSEQTLTRNTVEQGKIPGRTQLLLDSLVSEQVKVSAVEFWEDQENLALSSEQASKQPVGIQIDTEGKLRVVSKMTDIGKVVMQTHGTVELLKSLSHLEKDVQYERNIAIPKVSGTQLIESKEAVPPQEVRLDIEKYMNTNTDRDTRGVPQPVQDYTVPAIPENMPVFRDQGMDEPRSTQWDIMKSIVYGGLMESITSLSVVSSAAGGDSKTLNVVALGLANLVGGLFVLANGLRDLKTEEYGAVDKYQEVLGQRRNFWLHATVAVISYLVFGLVPPVTYGFSFYKSDNREYKLVAVAAASLFCIILLALGKAYTRTKDYIKTVLYFFIMGIMASGLSYVVGVLVDMLLKKLGLFESSTVVTVPPSSAFFETLATKPSWASY